MRLKKNLVLSIVGVISLILLVFGVTYAYLVIITNEEDIDVGSSKLDINYNLVNNSITGNFSPSLSREGGLKTTATASLNSGSEVGILNMYLTPTALTNLNIAALKWEAEGIRNGEVICSGTGNFSTASVNTPIKLFVNDINDNVNDCVLSTDVTTFNIYIWLDTNMIETAIGGASFGAKITADSVPITGGF